MKYTLALFFFLAPLLSFAQSEQEVPDSLPHPENVKIMKDSRLDLLEKRAVKLELDDRLRGGDKETVLDKPIMSASGKKKVTGSIYTAKGFRIIIYNGPDRKQAIEAKNKFSNAFGSQRSYMSYNVPSYKIKVGDFESKKDATDFLRTVSAQFPSSFIVPDIVTVKNINVSE